MEFAPRTADTLNALTAQRDTIATMITNAFDADDLERAEWQVRFVGDLWLSLGYGYKLDEMRFRVVERAKELQREDEKYLAKCRKNCKTRASTISNIARLSGLASL